MKKRTRNFLHSIEKKCQIYGNCEKTVQEAFLLLSDTVHSGGKIMTCGNGGSACDAEHIVGELMKGFYLQRPLPEEERKDLQERYGEEGRYMASHLQRAIPAISLVSGVALSTAYANDVAANLLFAQQVRGLGRPGDLLWGISTSGNSENVNYGLLAAKHMGLRTLGLTGRNGGRMAALCDVEIRVPLDDTASIQEAHIAIYHALCAALEEELFVD